MVSMVQSAWGSPQSRWDIPFIKVTEIREEAAIYGVED